MIPDRAAGKFGAINANRKHHGSENAEAGAKTSVISSSAHVELNFKLRNINDIQNFERKLHEAFLSEPHILHTIKTCTVADVTGAMNSQFLTEQSIFKSTFEMIGKFESTAISDEDSVEIEETLKRGVKRGAKKATSVIGPESGEAILIAELRKHAHEHAKATVKAKSDYKSKCLNAVKAIFHSSVIPYEILGLIDQRLGEFDDSIHYIEGYDLPREFISETTELDTGRRRYDVCRERGYLCILISTLKEVCRPKGKLADKTFLLGEFYKFSAKQNESMVDLFKRFYLLNAELVEAGLKLESEQLIVIMLGAL